MHTRSKWINACKRLKRLSVEQRHSSIRQTLCVHRRVVRVVLPSAECAAGCYQARFARRCVTQQPHVRLLSTAKCWGSQSVRAHLVAVSSRTDENSSTRINICRRRVEPVDYASRSFQSYGIDIFAVPVPLGRSFSPAESTITRCSPAVNKMSIGPLLASDTVSPSASVLRKSS